MTCPGPYDLVFLLHTFYYKGSVTFGPYDMDHHHMGHKIWSCNWRTKILSYDMNHMIWSVYGVHIVDLSYGTYDNL